MEAVRDTQLNRFAVVRTNGQADTQKDGSTYWSILDTIHIEFQSAGGNWNRPTMLLHNGKVVVESGLADLAWRYGEDKRKAVNAAAQKVREDHAPDWLRAFEQEINRP